MKVKSSEIRTGKQKVFLPVFKEQEELLSKREPLLVWVSYAVLVKIIGEVPEEGSGSTAPAIHTVYLLTPSHCNLLLQHLKFAYFARAAIKISFPLNFLFFPLLHSL